MSDHKLMKPAPFWLDDPALWFAQTEAQFWYFNVKDDFTKFNYIIAQLDKHCLTLVKDVVLSPPALNKYETLKSQLLSTLKEFKVKNIQEILTAVDIEDRKPSEFLNHLKDLAGQDIEDEYIKSVWSSRLPPKVQWVASFLTSSSLEKIAQLADLAINSPLMKSSENKANLASDIKPAAIDDDAMKELTKRVEQLSKKVEVLSLAPVKSAPQKISSKSKECTSSMTKTASTLNVVSQTSMYKTKKRVHEPLITCWYHTQFGWTATKCVQPCNFTVFWLAPQ